MPTSANLSLVTPASTDLVTNGASAMTTLANGIDGYYGPPTTYTPTTTNVTGATTTGRYVRIGKMGLVTLAITAGTATAAGSITLSLPAGWTNIAFRVPMPALNTNAAVAAYVGASATSVTVWADAAANNFTLGASVTGVRVHGWVWLT